MNRAETIRIPVLGYHHVFPENAAVADWMHKTPFALSPDRFRKQMGLIVEQGFNCLSVAAVEEILREPANTGLADMARRGIVITFDDGWENNLNYAVPVMESCGLTATIFVISGAIGQPYYMTWEQVRALSDAGMDIQSHTHSHRALGLLGEGEIREELFKSRTMIEDKIGKPVICVSFPNGSYDRRVLQISAEVYKCAYTSNLGFVTPGSPPTELPRLIIRNEQNDEWIGHFCLRETAPLRRALLIQKVKKKLMKTIGFRNYMRLHSLVYRTPVHELETIMENDT